MKRLSIVTTMYKTAAFLSKCIDSLLDQDIPQEDYEIILVNDGSPDRDLEVAQEYAAKFPNIKVISHENKGLAGARNTGVDAAGGEYITFVDPDDYIEPKSLSHLLDTMDAYKLDMLRMDYRMVDESYVEVPKPKDARLIDYSWDVMDGKRFLSERLGYACFVWTFIYRLSIIRANSIRFTQGIYFDDTDWLPRVLCVASRVSSIPAVRYNYLQRAGSLVKTDELSSHLAKLDGQIELIKILQGRKRKQDQALVLDWYERMASKLSMAVLDTVSAIAYQKRAVYISNLRQIGCFPLKNLHTTKSAFIKTVICNISPSLYCMIIRSR